MQVRRLLERSRAFDEIALVNVFDASGCPRVAAGRQNSDRGDSTEDLYGINLNSE